MALGLIAGMSYISTAAGILENLMSARLTAHAGPSTLRCHHIRIRRHCWSPASSHRRSYSDRQDAYRVDNDQAEPLRDVSLDEGAQPVRSLDKLDFFEGPPGGGSARGLNGQERGDEVYAADGKGYDLDAGPDETFDDVERELQRRRRKTEAKRMQRGGFLDHLKITVRGGKGGHGAAAFAMTQKGQTGSPSGGNGGPGGSVYLRTSQNMTSLHTVPRRVVGGTGFNGRGDTIHGKPGEDVIIDVPVGTVLREVRRTADVGSRFAGLGNSLQDSDEPSTGDNGKGQQRRLREQKDQPDDQRGFGLRPDDAVQEVEEQYHEEGEPEYEEAPEVKAPSRPEPMTTEEKNDWDKLFVLFPGAEFTRQEYRRAERVLRNNGRGERPPPTFDQIPLIIHDLEVPITGQPILLARGGLGGVGNPFFSGFSGYRQPRLAGRGLIPHTSTFELELKLLADVGLVGFPNVGKSTILRALTGRKAEVADYSFTTLNPQVGVVRIWNDGSYGGTAGGSETPMVVEETWKERDIEAKARERGEYGSASSSSPSADTSEPSPSTDGESNQQPVSDEDRWEVTRFTISDNPGLLPQASENVGLGHSFLRSIERSLALAYVLDITRPDPASDLMVLRNELEVYKPGLTKKGTVILLNKGDQVDEDVGKERLRSVQGLVQGLPEGEGMYVTVLSGKFGLGLKRVVQRLSERVERERQDAKAEYA